eukprot:CAMPEP_0171512496 /NCGR_PEP_ID=MMETSP0959-20130129/1626_1 /TAXON_ID=87120 /ORGANISM="Aurantiochytrium limacinum, Strain ATCCMYA-1381" /LENGTH=124 /DNA_ID=CAMNT_0012050327 /DNA_START=260 /DNA_END=634 /DNA_ORIENTATION=+
MGSNQEAKQFTLDNVHGASVYELRQECERRQLALPQNISHGSLMQCLIKDLLREKEEQEREYTQRIEDERRDLQERLAKQKAERKAAALERSRLRQEAAKAAVDTDATRSETTYEAIESVEYSA